MRMYREQGKWNLVDRSGVLICRGSYERVKAMLKLYR